MIQKKVLAAVSGGPDSMALLNIYKKKIFGVCHINYNKRKTAKRDQEIVKKFCKKNNINFFLKTVKKNEYKKHKSNNFQDVARKIRYDFFLHISEKYDIKKIYIAHNLDDFAESAYMQKKRKSETLFFGIKKLSNYKKLLIYRPLLHCRKIDLQNYCLNNQIEFGLDETNLSDLYERNVTRKIIQKWSKNKFEKFINNINLFNKKNFLLSKNANLFFNKWMHKKYEIIFFKNIPKKYKKHIIYIFLISNDIHSCSKNKINQIIQFIEISKLNSKFRVGNNKFIVKNNTDIKII